MESCHLSPKPCPAGYLLFGIFILSSPCHLIFVIPLLSGTLLGIYLSEHYLIIVTGLLLISVISAVASLRLLDRP